MQTDARKGQWRRFKLYPSITAQPGKDSFHGSGMTIPGFDVVDLEEFKHPFEGLADTPEGWRRIFDKTARVIRSVLSTHDWLEVLAKCVNQAMAGAAFKEENPRWPIERFDPLLLIEAAELEVLQALALMQLTARKRIPASPGSMARFLGELPKCLYAFSHMQRLRYPDDQERDHLIGKVRIQTMHYRNLFFKEDCEIVVSSIFKLIDEVTTSELGFAVSETFATLIALVLYVEERVNTYRDKCRAGLEAESVADALDSIDFFCSISPVARRAWTKCKSQPKSLDDLRWGAFQLSELCHSWPYVLDKDELRATFHNSAIAFFETISLRPGELASANLDHIFMNNPIWRKPLVAVDERTLFLPLPNLFYSFPFQIFEQFFLGRPLLEHAYSDARARVLEDLVETYISSGMPNAKTYRKVMWRDDSTGKTYENDVVALIGNTILLFEAKSGKLDDVARRGGELSLMKNLKELFIVPGEQAGRLETYLNTKGENAKLWIKDTGEIVHLDLATPKVVHKFSICIEHLAALTATKHNFKSLGIIRDEKAWAPVLSIGELILVWRHLDTEVSFFHYLTRRATFEDVIDFDGDELDVLSIYLVNGLCIDQKRFQGRQLRFVNVDGIARSGKEPRLLRTEFESIGVKLGYYWRLTLRQIYLDTREPHRFDILQVVLNQRSPTLAAIVEHTQKWKRGLTKSRERDLLLSEVKIGRRVFVLAYHLVKRPLTGEEWTERARSIAREVTAKLFDASDMAIFLRIKKSKELTYDAVSFLRLERKG